MLRESAISHAVQSYHNKQNCANLLPLPHKVQSAARARERENAAERARVHRKTITIFHRQKSFRWMRARLFLIFIWREIFLTLQHSVSRAGSHGAHSHNCATIKDSRTAQFLYFLLEKDAKSAHCNDFNKKTEYIVWR